MSDPQDEFYAEVRKRSAASFSNIREFMIYFTAIVFISGFIYVTYVENFRSGLVRLKSRMPVVKTEDIPKVTVIIPARNEEKYIADTLNSVMNQNYPPELFDVIAVDDRSTDGTGTIMESKARIYPNLSVIRIKEVSEKISPKKNAILTAVRSTDNEIIITTDGDCVHDPDWIRSLVAPVVGSKNENVGIVAGLSVFEKEYDGIFEDIWQNMQNIDYVSHSLIAAGSIGNGRAFTANGSNFLAKRALYQKEETGFKSELASGDDFFMIQAARESNYRLRFVFNRESIVRTRPVDDIKGLVEQRARWASKATYSSDFVLYFGINTFIFYVGLIAAFIMTLSGYYSVKLFTILFLMKFVPETLFLAYGFGKFGLDFKLRYYLPLQIFHIPFNIFVVLKSKISGFEWKGTKYRQ
ncbi:MAG: glycosyltransferase [Candidatus Delongbacteria bacterium]|jgi:cellulose synthase/poly-beta-1,6-N-acetylglucosamine synthase-like glycosyltransferase|nr:glycosyltransferase [Candidatus Delongbacteria bacterium]